MERDSVLDCAFDGIVTMDGAGKVVGMNLPRSGCSAIRVNVPGNSFVLQGPFGHQFTVDVNGSTNFNQGFALSSLPSSGGFVSLQGTVQQDGSILASDVEFITTDAAFVSGPILVVNPSSGPVQTVSIWVNETGGGTSGLVQYSPDDRCQRSQRLRH